MRIIGIDPGLATVGIGLLDQTERACRAVDWMTITTDRGAVLSERLAEMSSDLKKILSKYQPVRAVVERIYFAANKRSALEVAQARGAILLTLSQCGVQVMEVTPLQLKTAITGDGRADKRQMRDMLTRLLQLKDYPTPDDAADGLALALYGALMRAEHLRDAPSPARRATAKRVLSSRAAGALP